MCVVGVGGGLARGRCGVGTVYMSLDSPVSARLCSKFVARMTPLCWKTQPVVASPKALFPDSAGGEGYQTAGKLNTSGCTKVEEKAMG